MYATGLLTIILTCFSYAAIYFFGDALEDFVTLRRAINRMFQIALTMSDFRYQQPAMW